MDKILAFFRHNRYALLLLTLLLFQMLPSMVEGTHWLRKMFWGSFFALVMAAAAYTEEKHIRSFKPMLYLGFPTLILHLALTFSEGTALERNPVLTAVAIFLYLAFFGFLFWRVLRHIFFARQITLNTLFAAMSGYWLLGMAAGLLFVAIEALSPGSFSLKEDNKVNDLMYYAFITLTTVGYGEIVPLKAFARTVAVNLALFGQMYLTILLAFLVGKFASGEGKELIEEMENKETS